MEKINFMKQFAQRLREAMITAGYGSPRSPSGINIHQLVAITNHSPQMCRKYIRGEALPEASKLAEIASKLSVSPGWLLFGEAPIPSSHEDVVTIEPNLLHYIFTQASELHHIEQSEEEIANFLVDLARDVSQINTSPEQSKRIIDLAFSSVKHFY